MSTLQMSQTLRIGVFGSSAKSTKASYVEAAYRLGSLIAEKGHVCVNGAGRTGVMGGMNHGCRDKGGKIKGIIHKQFIVDDSEDDWIKDLLVLDGSALNERKDGLFDESDCLIVLPGGTGTFDEFWDCVSAKSLGMKNLARKPIVLVNIDGFYDGFIKQLQRAYDDGVLYMTVDKFFHVVSNEVEALELCIAECNVLLAGGKGVEEITRSKKRHETEAKNKHNSDDKLPQVSNDLAAARWSTSHLAVGVLSLALGVLIGLRLRK